MQRCYETSEGQEELLAYIVNLRNNDPDRDMLADLVTEDDVVREFIDTVFENIGSTVALYKRRILVNQIMTGQRDDLLSEVTA